MAVMQEIRGHSSLLWDLPTEIMIEIMKYSPSLSCLWSLANASSRFNSIFMGFAWEIVEEVMTKTTPPCTQTLMRIVLTARTSPETFMNYHDFSEYISMRKKFEPLHQKMSPQALCDLVELAHIIHGVAHACLEFYVEKSINMKPQRIHDNDLEDHDRMLSVLYSERQSPGQPIQPKEFGPPTYLEEQRIVRVLWRQQTFLDLKAACSEHALDHWPEGDHNNLEIKIFPNPEAEQICTVVDFLNEITGGEYSKSQYSESENALAHFHLHHPSSSMAIYDRGYHLPCFPKPGPISLQARHSSEEVVDIDTIIDRVPIGWSFYSRMTRTMQHSGIKHVSFEPYRKFGFVLWDRERMVELGVLAPEDSAIKLVNRHERFFIWRSLLTPEEDTERRSHKRCYRPACFLADKRKKENKD